jgi:hypothetical protein
LYYATILEFTVMINGCSAARSGVNLSLSH